MTSVLLGDIINSRKVTDHEQWLSPLKKLFRKYGKSPEVWEITRGDNFQIEIEDPASSLQAALQIKALTKSIGLNLDVRMAIGIGNKTFSGQKISESNGEAFINCGEKFETLRKTKQNLAIKTPWPDVDQELNLMIKLASITMDKWTASSAEVMHLLLVAKQPLTQKDLIQKLGVNQSSISERMARAHTDEIMELEQYYRARIKKEAAK